MANMSGIAEDGLHQRTDGRSFHLEEYGRRSCQGRRIEPFVSGVQEHDGMNRTNLPLLHL